MRAGSPSACYCCLPSTVAMQRVDVQFARELRGEAESSVKGCMCPAGTPVGGVTAVQRAACTVALCTADLRKGWPGVGSVSWFSGLVSLELGEVRAGKVPRRQLQCLDPSGTKQAAESPAAWCASQLPTSQQACLHVLLTLQIKCPNLCRPFLSHHLTGSQLSVFQ